MISEGNIHASDEIFAEMEECAPEPIVVQKVVLPEIPESSPVQQMREATIEQTGADPPPIELIHG